MTNPAQPVPPQPQNIPQQVPPYAPSADAPQGAQGAPYPYPASPAPDPTLPPAPVGAPEQSAPPAYGFDDRGKVRRTKVSGVWVGLIAAGLVLILLLIFIGQNMHDVGLHFLGFYGKVSVGLAMLVAALCGLLIALVPGTIRILQLRKALRRNVPDGSAHT